MADFFLHAPSASLPKGGGAIRGIGDKFSATPATGGGTMSIGLALSPGRGDIGPELALSYDSGAGNGPFGWGWSLRLPAVTRKTDKGLPTYRDDEESDVFVLSGTEDLVPVLERDAGGKLVRWRRASEDGKHWIRRYCPRVEGPFARIERWTEVVSGAQSWRMVTRDNVTSWLGKDASSCIHDPDDRRRTFGWLLAESHDDKGNAVAYDYVEDSRGVEAGVTEHDRSDRSRGATRYLKRVRYGNRVSRLAPQFATDPGWMFELVLDYGDHDRARPRPSPDARWLCRRDPFSTYRAGFEVRTYRLCQRFLMFHHFPEDSAVGADCLVRSTDLGYGAAEPAPAGGRWEDERTRGGPDGALLRSVTQTSYRRSGDGYDLRSLPPVDLAYSVAVIDPTVRELDDGAYRNLPQGIDGERYRWVDLDGEGICGVLSEQAEGWFYKPNLGGGRLAASRHVTARPATALAGGARLLDVRGDGKLDLVVLGGAASGYHERSPDGAWQRFVPFRSAPCIDWSDPALHLIDLTGDGHPDLLLTEEDAFTWCPSLDVEGFAPARRSPRELDEERGPRLVHQSATEAVVLADMSGDGLADLVRIRNGEVVYWPNLGHARFGAKVVMAGAPWFDAPDRFDAGRVRTADIAGTGLTDLIYLAGAEVHLYFNQSGNGFAVRRTVALPPGTAGPASVMVADLLGRGTACLVWSSPLPGDARAPVRYIDLMAAGKPRLLVEVHNNLGATTAIEYAASTQFYLADQAAGTPWITRLPFPVHVVTRVTQHDRWRGTTFATRYSYHHGYFDGPERELRGFGRVEQVDVEDYGAFAQANAGNPYVSDERLYQPPVKTVTWFHTGAFLAQRPILDQLAAESFPAWLPARGRAIDPASRFAERALPATDFAGMAGSADELCEAHRACKGTMLRQEVYELDAQALARGEHTAVRLFSAVARSCRVERLQARGPNRHAVFLATEREAVSYRYELDLRPSVLHPDPRIAHQLVVSTNELGQPLQTVSVAYPRVEPFACSDPLLPAGTEARIRAVQAECHLAYVETDYTADVDDGAGNHRLRVPCDVRSYQLTGIAALPPAGPRGPAYYSLERLRWFRLSETLQPAGLPVAEIAYHELPAQPLDGPPPAQKRLVEQVRTRFRGADLQPLALAQLGPHGLVYQRYKLALTAALLDAVLGSQLDRLAAAGESRHDALQRVLGSGGYLQEASWGSDRWWIPSGTAELPADAALRFFVPDRYVDPFGNTTRVHHHATLLFIERATDPLGNEVAVTGFDFRVLAPRALRDANANVTAVAFDLLGLPVASAVMGKPGSPTGDVLDGLAPDIDPLEIAALLGGGYDEARGRGYLAGATSRFVYDHGEGVDDGGAPVWAARPPAALAIAREQHVGRLAPGDPVRLQVALECSDGSGGILVKKIRAEPEATGGPVRWVVNGLTVVNNKGKPVKQYEPAFSAQLGFEPPQPNGVTTVTFYDAAGRVIRVELPDGTFRRDDLSPWSARRFDASDTVRDSRWYAERGAPDPAQPLAAGASPEQRAAWLAAQHAGTPSETHLDSLGRPAIGIVHDRAPDAGGAWQSARHATFTRLDAEGKPLWIRDARGNLVMQYVRRAPPDADAGSTIDDVEPTRYTPCYDLAGNLLYQHSMDAGDRWVLADAAARPMLVWDHNTVDGAESRRMFRTERDALRRPTAQWLTLADDDPALIESSLYCDTAGAADLDDAQQRNLIGRAVEHWDPSGLATLERVDVSGQPAHVTRTLARIDAGELLGWPVPGADRRALLEPETFASITEHDALGRVTRRYGWHRAAPNHRVAVYVPRYNERGLLAGETIDVGAAKTPDGHTPSARGPVSAIAELRYDAKGQRQYLALGNGTVTRYDHDPQTFRLRQLRTTRPSFDPPFPDTHAGLADARVLQQLSYTYDSSGNLTEIYDEAYEPAYFDNQQVEPRSRYVYDARYRLIEATGRENAAAAAPPPSREGPWPTGGFPSPDALRNYTQRYRYDAVGNLVEMAHLPSRGSGWTRHYATRTDSNRLDRTWYGTDETGAVTYHHDAHGNLLNLNRVELPSEPDADWGLVIRWDWRDMIASLDLGGGGTARYRYGIDKQRTRKHIARANGTTEDRIYLGGHELYRRRTAAGDVLEEIESLHLFAGDERVLLVDDVVISDDASRPVQTLFRYQHANHLGSAIVETDAAAQIISYEELHPYGTSAYRLANTSIEAPTRRYRYTGMERDDESGLGYHSARYYASWLGRWTASDPAALSDGVNTYSYSRDNPVNLNDHTGLAAGDVTIPKSSSGASLTSGKFVASGRYGWLHSLPGFTREHIIPDSWLRYLAESKYGPSAVDRIRGRQYRNAEVELFDNLFAGPKTREDIKHSARLRARQAEGLPIEGAEFYLMARSNSQAGGLLSGNDLAALRTRAVAQLYSYVKAERFVKMAAAGQSVPRRLHEVLKIPTSPQYTKPPASPSQVEVRTFAKPAPLKPPKVEGFKSGVGEVSIAVAPMVLQIGWDYIRGSNAEREREILEGNRPPSQNDIAFMEGSYAWKPGTEGGGMWVSEPSIDRTIVDIFHELLTGELAQQAVQQRYAEPLIY